MRLGYRLAFWLVIWLCVSFLIFNLVMLTIDPDKYSFDASAREVQHNGAAPYYRADDSDAGEGNVESSWGRRYDPHLIDTPGCRLPNPDLNHSSIHEVVRKLDPFVCPCAPGKGLTYVGENRTVFVNQNALVMVECFGNGERVYETFHVIPKRHPEVEQRCEDVLRQEQRSNGTDPTSGTTSHCGKTEERLSVMILLLDSVSRFNFHRSLPDSYRYLLDELDAVELDAYSRVGENTFPNFVPLLKGVSDGELRRTCWPNSSYHFDNCSFLWTDFAAAGYRTAFVEDQPDIGVFHFEKLGFKRKPTDYYGHSFIKEAYSLSHKQLDCLNDLMEAEFMFQWAYDLKSLFSRGERFFGVFFESRYTHDDVNKVQYVDGPLRRYLRRYKQDGLLDDTLLIVMGDHGLRFGEYRHTELGTYEVNLPSSFLVFPPEFRRRHPALMDNLRHNARNRLTTHYDVHQTLKDLLHCSYNADTYRPDGPADRPRPWPRGISLLRRIPEGRTCADAGIPTEFCPCQRSSRSLLANSTEAVRAALAVVHLLNHLTRKKRDLCATYELGEILGAKAVVMSDEQVDAGKLMYEVTLQVTPGGGLFQGTVIKKPKDNSTHALRGISRLNLYGNSSACIVGNAVLRKYCYCL